MPGAYWVEALNKATHLVNRWPCHTTGDITPFQFLLSTPPSYSHLWAFSCLCFPNQASTAPHKLAARSTPCVLFGYPTDHRGYKCLDLHSRRVLTSRHVVFDESQLPFLSEHFQTQPATTRPPTVTELQDSPVILPQPVAPHPIQSPGLGISTPVSTASSVATQPSFAAAQPSPSSVHAAPSSSPGTSPQAVPLPRLLLTPC